jgi:biofilm PGA synthesis N-glycosyltransferase PgaC
MPLVDAIIPVYAERLIGLQATLQAILDQSHPVGRIWIVDDGSPTPVQLPSVKGHADIVLHRFDRNLGISAARNWALRQSGASHVACINVDVAPSADWIGVLLDFMDAHPNVGCSYGRLVAQDQGALLSRWRMRFHEARYGDGVAPSQFAPGHAVLFRRDALLAVGGYDDRLLRLGEDSDVCERLRRASWETYYVPLTFAVSMQESTLQELARKQLVRAGWFPGDVTSRCRLMRLQTEALVNRLGRNLLKVRWEFLPVDVAVWLLAIRRLLQE